MTETRDVLVQREVVCGQCGTLFVIMIPSSVQGDDVCICPYGECAATLTINYDQPTTETIKGTVMEPGF